MKQFFLFLVSVFFVFFYAFWGISNISADCAINQTLKLGMKGSEVVCLQAKLGVNTDGSFGPITKSTLSSFQVISGLVADGIFGPRSKAALNAYNANTFYPDGCTSYEGYSTTTGSKCDGTVIIQPTPVAEGVLSQGLPEVFSVSPIKVRSGDIVTVSGENFSPFGNTVSLRYGQIEARFDNLTSSDGKTISFAFQPPEVDIMNKEEILALPADILKKILDPVKAAGGSIDDIVTPYKDFSNEDEIKQSLSRNGRSFDDLYDEYYVTVENVNGAGSSDKAILSGLRKLSFGSEISMKDKKGFFETIASWFDFIKPEKAYAQIPQGGFNSGIVMYCTCGDGYLTFMTDISGAGGSGLYWWSSGFVPLAGNPIIAGPQLGFYTPNAGYCSIYVGLSCAAISANIATNPWGQGI